MTASTLPVHPVTGRTALGWRKPRPGEDEAGLYPVWPILGAADDDDDGDGQDGDGDAGDDADDDQGDDAGDTDGGDGDGQDDDADPEGADQLGDPGKKALASMKDKLRKERERRKAAEGERDKLKGSGDADDPERIRNEATQAATARANARIVRSEIRAAAAGKLTNPRDALHFLDVSQFEVDEDGQVDEDEIADAIDDLLKERPYLGAAAKGQSRFQGTGDGGARKGTGGPKQLTEQQVKKMTPEQIDEAHRKGQLRDYLGG
ncbi:hypothetical protein ACL02U_09625 [Streptomyces sp. MS06]|uniref:hypothetical protein n=1 Tax=Streptomyces sp. MS06 TaxID=3385974 RepID=UPI0039A3E046